MVVNFFHKSYAVNCGQGTIFNIFSVPAISQSLFQDEKKQTGSVAVLVISLLHCFKRAKSIVGSRLFFMQMH